MNSDPQETTPPAGRRTPMHAGDFFFLLKEAGSNWVDNNAMRLSAALAYYAVFSLAPLFIISISMAGIIFGEDAAAGKVAEQLNSYVGSQVGEAIESIVKSASAKSNGLWATVIGLLVLLFGASSVFGELKGALNTIWGVTVKPGRPFFTLFLDRLLSFSMVLVIGFLLLASLLVSALVAGVSKYASGWLPIPADQLHYLDIGISMIVITALFGMIFRLLPNAIIHWRDVWIGAWVTSLLFILGKLIIGLYLGKSGVASTFGAAGSLIVILLWIYYSACILFFGAEFTKACACKFGEGVIPDKWAVSTTGGSPCASPPTRAG